MNTNDFPYWIVIGRKFDNDIFALEFARMKAVELKKPISVMQRDDISSPAFVLCNIKANEHQLDIGL